MTHYYDDHTYTPEQARHANGVVLDLIRNRRFFLHNPNSERSFYKQDYGLNPAVFGEAIELDARLRRLYVNVRTEAIEKITVGEISLGTTPPNLDNNRQLVVCNRYGGGFEICRTYPLSAFVSVAPTTLEGLVAEHLDSLIGGRSLDEIAPKTVRGYEERANFLARCIWSEFEQLELFDPLNRRCVVLMESKLSCSGSDHNRDFADSRVADMQSTPFALGYLFWKFSKQTRIVQHNHVVFGTSRESHVNVQHWSDSSDGKGSPKINYNAGSGYDCSVIFVTAL